MMDRIQLPDEPCKCGKYMLQHWWAAVTDAGKEGTDRTKHSRESCLTATERERARLNAIRWEEKTDEYSDAINVAFPTRSGSHAEYAKAMTMVGNRHSKGELVALVNWLLVAVRDAEGFKAELISMFETLKDVQRASGPHPLITSILDRLARKLEVP
jgi:hypothetical protein